MKQRERTRKLLLMHYQVYPKLQIQDIFKYLYQSAFGCEHSVSSLEAVTDYIAQESVAVFGNSQTLIEPLDGEYSRIHLAYLKQGLSVNTLGKLFFMSAKKELNGTEDLIQKLKVAKELVCEKLLPFSENEFEKAVREWEANGYGAMHHSDAFREEYKPAYRVIANRYIPFLPLLAELDKRLEKGMIKVALEGGSASGKTTLSEMLKTLYACTVFHMDDFFLQPYQRTPKRYAEIGGNIDYERFLKEVLIPLDKGEIVNYRKFDCAAMELGEPVAITPKKLTIVEGAYSMHTELAAYYDLSVFLDILPELQKERILKRNSPEMANRFFEEWIPLENIYFSKTQITKRCDLQISILE